MGPRIKRMLTKSLHKDMVGLYKSGHYGAATLDCAELYLQTAKSELEEQLQSIQKISIEKSRKLRALNDAHAERLALWMQYDANKVKVERVNKELEKDWFTESKK